MPRHHIALVWLVESGISATDRYGSTAAFGRRDGNCINALTFRYLRGEDGENLVHYRRRSRTCRSFD